MRRGGATMSNFVPLKMILGIEQREHDHGAARHA
jgi:hypothetical protein